MDPLNITHIITRAELVGDKLVGDAQVLMQTPKGQILGSILNDPNTQFGVRGYGNIDAKGVVSNFMIHSVNVFIESATDRARQAKLTAQHNYNRAMGVVKK